jgi:clan AA aspartic protease
MKMGTFLTTLQFGDSEGQRWGSIQALVDTGASYSWVPGDILARLAVQPQFKREFVTADGRVILRDMAETFARLDGQVLRTLVVFGSRGSLAVLGAYTLEGFGLSVDPVNKRLVPVRGFAT